MSLTDRELLARALRFYEGCPDGQYDELMVELIRERLAQQEPAAWKWQQAPIRTAWGAEMVVASVAIDKDHTLSLYCEHDQTTKVDAMFAQRTWVNATTWRGLTDEEYDEIWRQDLNNKGLMDLTIAKLKEKNT